MGKTRSKNIGFTLIELLTVISVIGLLSAVILVSLNSARTKARDSRRLADTSSILTALSLYYDDNGKFGCHSYSPHDSSTDPNFLHFLSTSGYVTSRIKDPVNNNNYNYEYATLHRAGGGPCGQNAYLGITTEKPITSCPGSGALVGNNHCHIFLPNNPNCGNVADDAALNACTLWDTTNEY
jgi:prepilin-type N-terminal cleavage/methylation domain-containing protein